MSPVTEVVSARVDKAIKMRAESVIIRNGSSFSEVITNTLAHIAETGTLPESATQMPRRNSSIVSKLRSIREGMKPDQLMKPMTRDQIKDELAGKHD